MNTTYENLGSLGITCIYNDYGDLIDAEYEHTGSEIIGVSDAFLNDFSVAPRVAVDLNTGIMQVGQYQLIPVGRNYKQAIRYYKVSEIE